MIGNTSNRLLPESLRNPVQAIALQANIALRIASKSLDLEDHLVQIERACRDLSRLLQGLLEAAELDAGRMPVASQPLRVTGFLNEMLAQHVPFITQVNAVQHSGSPEVRVEATADADVVSTRVIDYGCGIPVATRGESSRSSRAEPSASLAAGKAGGLGLYFCRLATERMGGELQTDEPTGADGVRNSPADNV